MNKLSILLIILGVCFLSGAFYINSQITQMISNTETPDRVKYIFDTRNLSISNLNEVSFKMNVGDKSANITVLRMPKESINSILSQFFIEQSGTFIPKSTDLCNNFLVTTSKFYVGASDSSKILVENIECR